MPTQMMLGEPVFWFTGACTLIWVVAELIVPSARKAIFESHFRDVPAAAARLRLVSGIKTLASIASLAGATAIGLFFLAQSWLENSGNAAGNLETLVSYREKLSGVLESTGFAAAGVWVAGMAVLALIWIAVARSGSRKRWEAAVKQRRSALIAEHETLDIDALIARLGGPEAEVVTSIRVRMDAVEAGNRARLQEMQTLPVVALGEQRRPHSIADLEELRRLVEMEIERLSSAEEGETPDSETERKQSLEKAQGFAEALGKLLSDIQDKLEIRIDQLNGFTTAVALSAFEAHARPDDQQVRFALENASVDLRMKNHARLGAEKARREPEMIREWIGAIATSRGSVRTSSLVGRTGGAIALAALFLGLFGFSAHAAGNLLVDRSQAIEFTLVMDRNSAAVHEAMAGLPPSPDDSSEPADLADDTQAEQYVRSLFRASVARDVAFAQRTPQQALEARRAAFQLAAAQARQDVLQASARSAPPPLDRGAPAVSYERASGRPAAASADVTEIFDDAVRRQTAQLRSNPSLWQAIRAEAVRPATSAYAADALFDTAFGAADIKDGHAMRVFADRAAADFSREVVRTGSPAKAASGTVHHGSADVPLTLQDRRNFEDFRRQVPERLNAQSSAYRSGAMDPGSLSRVSSGARASPPDLSGRPTGSTRYADLFPALADSATDVIPPSAGGGGGGGNGFERSARTARTAPVARSFARIRFSGRVGGVVIGREPDAVTNGPDVVDLNAYVAGPDAFTLKLTMRDGTSVTLGPYHPTIIHHALAYAADGRVVTSTLPATFTQEDAGLDIPARQVMVHPAFEDTAFACPAIQVDRFVDTFMFAEGGPKTLAKLQTTRQGVQQLGLLLAIFADATPNERSLLAQELMRRSGPEALAQISAHVRSCGQGKECFPLDDYERLGFRFDGARALLACLANSDPQSCSDRLQKLAPTAAYAVDSGVRERPYVVDRDFRFVSGVGLRSDALWPLDFMIQAVPQSSLGDDVDVDVAADASPWEFPSIADDLRAAVAAGVARDQGYKDVLAQMQEFTLLQRLFRTALGGDLGLDFPLHRLPQLQRTTQKYVKPQRNERWNITAELVDMLAAENETFRNHFEGLGESGNVSGACLASLSAALDAEEKAPWPEGAAVWKLVSELEKTCGSAGSQDILRTRDTLRTFDLVDEAIFIAGQHSSGQDLGVCPPL